jgi:hypothetical protein
MENNKKAKEKSKKLKEQRKDKNNRRNLTYSLIRDN